MNPTDIIERATEEGVVLALSPSGSISAKGVQSAIDRWFRALQQSRADIVKLLRPDADGWAVEDWLGLFDERAGIAEFDGGLSRTQAEVRAFACRIAEWLNRNPAYSPAGTCFGCGSHEASNHPLLAFGIGNAGCVWLHSRCQPVWYAGRRAEAIVALAAMGIAGSAEFPDDFGKNGAT